MEFALRYAVALIEGQLSVAASAHKDILLQHIQSLREAQQRLLTLTEAQCELKDSQELARLRSGYWQARVTELEAGVQQLTTDNQALRERERQFMATAEMWVDYVLGKTVDGVSVGEQFQIVRDRLDAYRCQSQQPTSERGNS